MSEKQEYSRSGLLARITAGRWRITWGWAAGLMLLLLARPVPASILAGLPVVLLGELIRVLASGSLIKEKQLTNWGIYAHIRHPLYVGSTLIGLGFIVMARSVWLAIPMMAIFVLIYSRTVSWEEKRMEERYGDLYREWVDRVPRFFPRRLSVKEIREHFTLKRARVNLEHQAVLGVVVATAVLYLIFTLFAGSIAFAAQSFSSPQGFSQRLDAPDVTEIVRDLGFEYLTPPAPVFYLDRFEGARSEARQLQVAFLEANGFWRSMMGGFIEGTGVIFSDSPSWVALRADRTYGFPATRVQVEGNGLMTILSLEGSTQFSEDASETAMISPLNHRGPLLAHGLATKEGAARYARSWAWILYAEDISGSLRIRSDLWWQRRLVGCAAACMFLESSRGGELVPGTLEPLDAWSEFWTGYLNPRAISLAEAGWRPPTEDPRVVLELDARLYQLGRELWRVHGLAVFALFRAAWPIDVEYEDPLATLEALWTSFPEQREAWEWRVLTPREPPQPPPPSSSTPTTAVPLILRPS
ncbi:methyltransferase family protein [Gemmatimonadota bacterium]